MARKKKAENVKIEDVTTAKAVEEPKVEEQPGNKIPEPKVEEKVEEKVPQEKESINEVKDDGTIKVDLDKWAKLNSKEETKEEPKEEPKQEEVAEVKEEVKEEEPVEEITEITVDEITDEVEEVKQEVEEAISESKETGVALPENIQKVVDFVNETGGTLEDYVALNKDYSKMSDTELLGEYFKQTKPHLNDEERLFVMEDLYSYNEEEDDPKEIKRKKLALKLLIFLKKKEKFILEI